MSVDLFNIFPKKEADTPARIVHIDDAAGVPVASLEAGIEPVQDLHGYDAPWPGGGGKNILPITEWFQSGYTNTNHDVTMTINADGSLTLSGTANGQFDFYLSRTTSGVTQNPFYVDAGTYTISMTGTQTSSGVKLVASGSGKNGYPYSEASSNGAAKTGTVTDATQPFNYLLLRVTDGTVSDGTYYIQFESGSTGTAWEPYANICPISGKTGLLVHRTGKNLIDPAKKVATSATTAKWYNDGTGFLLHGGQAYVLSGNISTDATYFVYLYDMGGTQLAYGKWTATYTPSADVYVYFQYYESGGAHLADAELQLELGSTATTYETYSGNTCAVDWTSVAGTVYHGTVDPVAGQLTVDWASVDMGSLSWSAYGGTAARDRYITSGLDTLAKNSSSVLCSAFRPRIGNETIVANMVWIASGNSKTSATTKVGAYANANAFKTAMSGQQLVYELATPQTYQLTPQEVRLLTGKNNVWIGVGEIAEFEYYAEIEPTPINGMFVDGESLQADGWFMKWRKLAAPIPKTDYTSVYGRDSSIDLTEASGDVFYEDRTVNLDMVYIGDDWNAAYSNLLNKIHGKKCMVQFTNDPYWYWSARLVANEFSHKSRSLSMNGVAFPYKLSILEKSYQASVSGATEQTATVLQLEGSRMRVSPKVVVTGEVTLKWGSTTKTISAGTYYVRGLKVGLEGVTLKVYGTGTVTITYREGSL